eukprot:4155071-Amphidinium_carterae.2
MRTQDCRQLKIKRVKKRPTGFAAPSEAASPSGGPPVGEAAGGLFPWASNVLPGETGDTGDVGPGRTGTTGDVGPGSTGITGEGPPGRTGGLATAAPGEPACRIWLLFQKRAREPD